MEIVQCHRGGSESGRRRAASGDIALLLGSVRSRDPGEQRSDPGTAKSSIYKGTSGVRKTADHMPDIVRSSRRRRKLALCMWSYWALLCLQIHVLKAQGKENNQHA